MPADGAGGGWLSRRRQEQNIQSGDEGMALNRYRYVVPQSTASIACQGVNIGGRSQGMMDTAVEMTKAMSQSDGQTPMIWPRGCCSNGLLQCKWGSRGQRVELEGGRRRGVEQKFF